MSLVKLSLDCFNSADGTGLFAGVARYNVLEQRLPLAAIKARDMFGMEQGAAGRTEVDRRMQGADARSEQAEKMAGGEKILAIAGIRP